MALDFPSSPVLNDTYSVGSKTWVFNGTGWRLMPAALGTNTTVTFSDSGTLSGATGFTFNKTTNTVSIANTIVVGGTVLNSTMFAGTANNASFLNGQPATYYANATNITSGSLPYAQIPANVANTTGAFTFSGIHTHSANIIMGPSAAITANGTAGASGQVLTSNGTAVFWTSPAASGVTSVASGSGLTGGPITGTGTLAVNANNGIASNATGVYVIAANGTQVTAAGVNVLAGNGQIVSNTTGLWISQGNIDHNSLSNYVSSRHIDHSAVSVATGAGLSGGGDLTSTRTLAVVANNGIVANSTGVFVNAAYIATVTANNSLFLGGTAAASYQLNSTLAANVSNLSANNATNLAGQAASYYTNANNLTSGTLPYERIPPNVANTSGSFTFAGINTFGANVIFANSTSLVANGSPGTNGQVLTSNGSAIFWSDGGGAAVDLAATLVSVTSDPNPADNDVLNYIKNSDTLFRMMTWGQFITYLRNRLFGYPGTVSGRYYSFDMQIGATNNPGNIGSGKIRAYPIRVQQPITFDQLAVYVSTGGGNARVALYNHYNGNSSVGASPSTLVAATPSFSTAAGGRAASSLVDSTGTSITSTTVLPGIYWGAVQVDANTVQMAGMSTNVNYAGWIGDTTTPIGNSAVGNKVLDYTATYTDNFPNNLTGVTPAASTFSNVNTLLMGRSV